MEGKRKDWTQGQYSGWGLITVERGKGLDLKQWVRDLGRSVPGVKGLGLWRVNWSSAPPHSTSAPELTPHSRTLLSTTPTPNGYLPVDSSLGHKFSSTGETVG